MKFKIKETILLDGSKVHDIDIFANGKEKFTNKPMCIFSCSSFNNANSFFLELEKLVEKHTMETFTEK